MKLSKYPRPGRLSASKTTAISGSPTPPHCGDIAKVKYGTLASLISWWARILQCIGEVLQTSNMEL